MLAKKVYHSLNHTTKSLEDGSPKSRNGSQLNWMKVKGVAQRIAQCLAKQVRAWTWPTFLQTMQIRINQISTWMKQLELIKNKAIYKWYQQSYQRSLPLPCLKIEINQSDLSTTMTIRGKRESGLTYSLVRIGRSFKTSSKSQSKQ